MLPRMFADFARSIGVVSVLATFVWLSAGAVAAADFPAAPAGPAAAAANPASIHYRVTLDRPVQRGAMSLFIAKPQRFARPPQLMIGVSGRAPVTVSGTLADEGAQVDFVLPSRMPAGATLEATGFSLSGSIAGGGGEILPVALAARIAGPGVAIDLPWQAMPQQEVGADIDAGPPGTAGRLAAMGVPVAGFWWAPSLPGAGYGIEIRNGQVSLAVAPVRADGGRVRLSANGPLQGQRFLAPLMAEDRKAGTIDVTFLDDQTARVTAQLGEQAPMTLTVRRISVVGELLP
ncbi:MAG: hypothetical protein P4M00_08985 [Azospirillaceae bacterium]|nr:hypothetical protein [Azospirillaceae bacterium]